MKNMKLVNKVILLLLVTCQCAWSQPAFDTANELYRKGDFAKAAEAYESLLKTGKESAEVYFNLANAYYKQNKVAPAIYNYEKALLLDPNDAEIKNNLSFAQKMQIDEIKEVKNVGLQNWVRQITLVVHYNTWAMIAVGFSTLFLLLFLGYYFTASTLFKRIFFGGMLLVLLFLLLSILAAVFERGIYQSERPAIVFSASVGVKSEPSQNVEDAFVLHEGTKVHVVESLDDWRKIELPDGNQGWISHEAIRELK